MIFSRPGKSKTEQLKDLLADMEISFKIFFEENIKEYGYTYEDYLHIINVREEIPVLANPFIEKFLSKRNKFLTSQM